MTFPVFWRNPQHVAGRCVPLKTRAVRPDRSNPTGELDGERPRRERESERMTTSCWRFSTELEMQSEKGQYCALMRNIKCLLRVCFAFHVPLPPTLPLSPSFLWFWFCAEISIHSPPLPMRTALNSSRCTSERQSHKTSFYAGLISWMGLSLCTILDSNRQKLQTGVTTPTRRGRPTDRQTSMLALIFFR